LADEPYIRPVSSAQVVMEMDRYRRDIIGIRREGGAGSAVSSGWNHLDSTWEKSKRKTERNLATECRKGDAGVRNQLGR